MYECCCCVGGELEGITSTSLQCHTKIELKLGNKIFTKTLNSWNGGKMDEATRKPYQWRELTL